MRFQNKIVVSSFALPFVVVWAILVSVAAYLLVECSWASLPAIAASTYCMLEMNNQNILLRKRSRMVSCCFLLLTMMCASVSSRVGVSIVQLCFAGAIFLLTFTYQNKNTVGIIFYASLLISIASVVWTHVLWLVLLLVLVMYRPLASLSFRGINAILFGLILPYVLYGVYRFFEYDWMWWKPKFTPLLSDSVFFNYSTVEIGDLLSYIMLSVLTIGGTVHFMSYSYQDKLRPRMLYWMYIILAWGFMALLAVMPFYADYLLPLLVIPASVLTAHLYTHTSSRFSNISFIVALILTCLITLFNQCLTSLSNMALGACL